MKEGEGEGENDCGPELGAEAWVTIIRAIPYQQNKTNKNDLLIVASLTYFYLVKYEVK